MKRILQSGLVFIMVFFCGCESGLQKNLSQIVKINIVNEPPTLDPRRARDPYSQTVLRMLFDGLTRINQNDQPELALAKEVEISDDLKTYTFTLRDAKWSNADPIRAQDFVYAWQKILSPDFPSDNAFQLFFIKNAKKVKEATASFEELGVRAIDDKTLVVELEYVVPYFLELLSTPLFFPIHSQIDQKNPNWAQSHDTYVSNGPFVLKRWRHHDEIVVKKNPNYWDADTIRLEGIELIMVDADVEMKLFEQNQLHWAGSPLSTIPTDSILSLKKKNLLFAKSKAETNFLRTNTKAPLLKHPKMRKALALSIDRSAMISHVLQGSQIPALRLVPPSMQLQAEPYFEDQNIEVAQILFQEVLEEEGFTLDLLPKMRLTYISSERNHKVAQVLQQQWREALGIWIELEALESKVYFDRISQQQFDLAFCSWIADFHDPINFLEVFKFSSMSTNNTQWENPEYIQGLDCSCSFSNPKERFACLAKCEKILMQEMPIIPIFHNTMTYRKKDVLKETFLSSLGNLDFKWAFLEIED